MNQISLKNEIHRKIAHFSLILIPILYCVLGKWISVSIFILLSSAIVSLDYLRRTNPAMREIFFKIFGTIIKPHEFDGDKFSGVSWVAFATCLNFLLFKDEIAVTAFLILVVCDAAAAIIGKNFSSPEFFEKTQNGSLAFFASGFLVILICGLSFGSGFWFYFFGLFALVVVTIIEARPSLIDIDDGFLIPISFSVIMTFFDIMWNYAY
jgi:dolichol kinase